MLIRRWQQKSAKKTKHSPPILAEMLDIGDIAVLAILMDLMVKYSINHHKIDF